MTCKRIGPIKRRHVRLNAISGRTVLAFLFSVAAITSTSAQVSVTGHTMDSTGAPIPMVLVSGGGQSILTESDGSFRITLWSAEDSIVRLRRSGFNPVEVTLGAEHREESEVDLGGIVMAAIPFTLDEISVEAAEPTLTPRAVREIETMRRTGGSYIFTAEDIDRIKPAQLSALATRLPRGTRVDDGYGGSVVRFQNRGCGAMRQCYCTPTVFLNGQNTGTADLDLIAPDMVGGMVMNPGACVISVWTKPIQPGEESPFEIGGHFGARFGDEGEAGRYLGVHLVTPVRRGHGTLRLRMALGARAGGNTGSWLGLLSLSIAPFGLGAPLYAGTGVGFSKGREVTPEALGDPLSVHHTVIAGLSLDVAFFRPFVEFHCFDPLKPSDVTVSSQMGLSYRFGT